MLQMNIRKMSFDIDSMQSIQQRETTLDYFYSTQFNSVQISLGF